MNQSEWADTPSHREHSVEQDNECFCWILRVENIVAGLNPDLRVHKHTNMFLSHEVWTLRPFIDRVLNR